MSRYARQMAVPVFGALGQERLRAARVLVVGAGGLAAPVLQYLVGAGLGRIRLVDFDRIERGNLHRQTLFRECDLGRTKVAAAAETLAALNPDCDVEAVQARLDPGNAAGLADGAELILDCADSFAASYILSDLCRDTCRPFISGSAIGTDGYVGAFCGGAPSLRAVFPDLPQRLGSCAEDGVLGPVLGVVGGLQAQMALAILADITPSPLGRLVSYDGRLHRFGGFDFTAAPEPAQGPAFIAPLAITTQDFVADLRAETEAPLARPYALRLPVEAFGSYGPRPAPGQRAVLCCRSGLRAWTAAKRLSAVWPGEIALVALGDPDGDAP
jgi:molybdopterin/thiamine biosynthesis adenylyltransferase